MEQSCAKQASQTVEMPLASKQSHVPHAVCKDPLLPRLKRHFRTEVSTEHTDILLLSCCLVSGLLDSVVYSAWGTFVSMQTGNTIFVGLGASGQNYNKPFGWAKSLTSIGCFVLGSLFFSRFCRLLTPLRRRTLVSSFLLQTFIIFVSAAIVEGGVVDGTVQIAVRPIQWTQEITIALLSFQAAGQMVGSRNLNLSEIPTVVLTSVLCDFASDPKLVSPLTSNAKRNRRFLAFVFILVGAIVGGWIAKAAKGMWAVLWIAGGIKLLITFSWLVWPEKEHVSLGG